jgi:hypothetical protein
MLFLYRLFYYYVLGGNMEQSNKYKLNIVVDPDVMPLLDELAGSERKRGFTISNLIRTAYAGQKSSSDVRTMDVEGLRLLVMGLAGRVQAVEGEMIHMRTQLAAMMARGA